MAKGNDSDRYVQPNTTRGGWDIVKEDRGRVSAHTTSKSAAVKRAREIVRNLGGGEIRVRGTDGVLADSITIAGPKHQESKAKDGPGRPTGRAPAARKPAVKATAKKSAVKVTAKKPAVKATAKKSAVKVTAKKPATKARAATKSKRR